MNEHKNIITIEDEIKEFSDKPVKSSALFKKFKDAGVPDSSEASAGDVLSLDEDKKPTWSAPSGGGGDLGDIMVIEFKFDSAISDYVATKTITEIAENYYADKNSYLCIDAAAGCVATGYQASGSSFRADFKQLQKDGNDYYYIVYSLTIGSDNSVTYNYRGNLPITAS